MIMAILAVYGGILVVLEKLGVIVWSKKWAASFPALWLALQLIILIPMAWGSPQGAGACFAQHCLDRAGRGR